jgi:hypothetical protein
VRHPSTPKDVEVDPKASAYTGNHPILRIPGQAMIVEVTPLPAGGLVAVGYGPPAWVPATGPRPTA